VQFVFVATADQDNFCANASSFAGSSISGRIGVALWNVMICRQIVM
jgi:hypothetical protein